MIGSTILLHQISAERAEPHTKSEMPHHEGMKDTKGTSPLMTFGCHSEEPSDEESAFELLSWSKVFEKRKADASRSLP